jgi:hypothetical protein
MLFPVWCLPYVYFTTCGGLSGLSSSFHSVYDVPQMGPAVTSTQKNSEIRAKAVLELLQIRMVGSIYILPISQSNFIPFSELLSEIPLMESGIADFSYPHMFPSPPDMGIDQEFAVIEDGTDESPNMNAPLIPRHGSFLRREQEQSWFYYLSEISLRRIGNRVINTFYQDLDYDQAWLHMDAEAMTHIAEEFMSLLNQWHIGLPPLVRFHAENLNEVPDEELAFMLRARVLEIRSWIFRPFLFYAIHHPETDPQQHLLWSWVQQAMHNSFLLIETSSLPHRHHGVWYTLRVAMIAAFSLIAAAKNRLQMPDGWRGAVQLAIETLRHWELEGPEDVRKSRVILEELLRNMQEEPGDERLDTQPQNDV